MAHYLLYLQESQLTERKLMSDLQSKIKQRLQEENIKFILAQFTDMHGNARVKLCPVSYFDSLVEDGAGFAGAAVAGMGQGPHDHDMKARIDLNTYTRLGWQPDVVRFATSIYVDGKPHPYCARTNLQRVLNRMEEKHGWVLNIGIEPEHFLVQKEGHHIKPWNPDDVDHMDKPCYDFKSMAPAMSYLKEITHYCNELDWGVYQADHEDAPGQYEINFDYSDALTTADRFIFFKMMANQVARKHGAIVTFMAKPFSDRTGSGAHIHFHLADKKTGENLFEDENDPRGFGLSELAYQFIGGVAKHAPALCAITSPTTNCFKRLQMGPGLYSSRSGFTWTPAFISYGDNNRTQMLRICGPGHIEDRTVSAAFNPYLGLAAYLSAGLSGIKEKINPGEPNLDNMYALRRSEIYKRGLETLPQSLREALIALEQDPVLMDALGPIQKEYIKLKWQEWNEYHSQISDWEIQHYLTFH